KVNENKIRISEIDKEIEDLLSKVVGANNILMEYINNKIEALDAERKRLQEENVSLTYHSSADAINVITDHVAKWDETSFEDKQAVVDTLIKVITIADGNIEIVWNI
ncbi:MAG: recombinase family protein, partial [Clostridia bacterium]|nr:recombinase family protein [Clostridia bacterium]